MKPTLLICKGGSVFRTRESCFGNAVGEQGETEGVIRHLAERNDINLVYFGQYRGEHLCNVVSSHIGSLNEWSTSAAQVNGWDLDALELEQYRPIIGLIQTAGYSPTMSTIDNARGAIVQSAGVRYTAPMHAALRHFKLPRIVINNDPRTYPRDQEMSFGWKYSRPAALLDQWDRSVVGVVGGRKYVKKSVWSRCESWAYHKRTSALLKDECNIIAHSHMNNTGIRTGSSDAWNRILEGNDYPVYGAGWLEGPRFKGRISPSEVRHVLQRTMCCPVVAHTPGFYTGKPYVLEACGCIPVIFGDGVHTHTWDVNEVFVNFDSELRAKEVGDLERIAGRLADEPMFRSELQDAWAEMCKPHWRLLDDLVDDLVAGVPRNTLEWREKYGGYYSC